MRFLIPLFLLVCCFSASSFRHFVAFIDTKYSTSALIKTHMHPSLNVVSDCAPKCTTITPTALLMSKISSSKQPQQQGIANERNTRFRWRDMLTATNILVLLNLVMYFISTVVPSVSSHLKNNFLLADSSAASSMMMPSPRQSYGLFTSLFLHDGNTSLPFIFTNIYALLLIGPVADRLFGTARFLATYFAAGVLANIGTTILRSVPAAGASGCIFGLFGALGTTVHRNRAIVSRSETSVGTDSFTVIKDVAQPLSMYILYGMLMPQRMLDHGAQMTGGLIGGMLFAYLFGPRLFLETSGSGHTSISDRPIINYKPFWTWRLPFTAAAVATAFGLVYGYFDIL